MERLTVLTGLNYWPKPIAQIIGRYLLLETLADKLGAMLVGDGELVIKEPGWGYNVSFSRTMKWPSRDDLVHPSYRQFNRHPTSTYIVPFGTLVAYIERDAFYMGLNSSFEDITTSSVITPEFLLLRHQLERNLKRKIAEMI